MHKKTSRRRHYSAKTESHTHIIFWPKINTTICHVWFNTFSLCCCECLLCSTVYVISIFLFGSAWIFSWVWRLHVSNIRLHSTEWERLRLLFVHLHTCRSVISARRSARLCHCRSGDCVHNGCVGFLHDLWLLEHD